MRYLKVRKKIYSLQVQKKKKRFRFKMCIGEESSLLRYRKINDPQGEENLEVNLKRLQGPTYRWR